PMAPGRPARQACFMTSTFQYGKPHNEPHHERYDEPHHEPYEDERLPPAHQVCNLRETPAYAVLSRA
ncbi:hypothetical protein, partial [Streptomyces sp. YS-3]|uniref:hypothetical protein n=1 Tax=Streptomyces sp. YS-3 TaxID=3381352 RepID=UPI0038626E33